MELAIDTKIGILTGVFESCEEEPGVEVYVAHLKERPGIIVQADSVVEAIGELIISLDIMLEIETEEAMLDLKLDERGINRVL